MKKVLIHVQVWGEYHSNLFIKKIYPNLIRLADSEIDIPWELVVDTDLETLPSISYIACKNVFIQPCIELSEGETDYPYVKHRESLDAICKKALAEDAVIIWVHPDQFDAIGTLKTALQKIREGYRYIFMPPTRVNTEFVDEIPIMSEPRECVSIALKHLHEMHKGCYIQSYETGGECACHPYALIAPKQDGFEIFALQGYVIALYPRQWTPTRGGTDNEVPITEWIGDFEKDVWVFEDSDQGFRVDISSKERHHHFRHKGNNFTERMDNVLSAGFCTQHKRIFLKGFYVHT